MEYRYRSHTVFQIEYHFVWVTKYRYKVLTGDIAGSGRQGCESRRVKVPLPSVAQNGRLAYPLLGEVTDRDRRGRKSHGRPVY